MKSKNSNGQIPQMLARKSNHNDEKVSKPINIYIKTNRRKSQKLNRNEQQSQPQQRPDLNESKSITK